MKAHQILVICMTALILLAINIHIISNEKEQAQPEEGKDLDKSINLNTTEMVDLCSDKNISSTQDGTINCIHNYINQNYNYIKGQWNYSQINEKGGGNCVAYSELFCDYVRIFDIDCITISVYKGAHRIAFTSSKDFYCTRDIGRELSCVRRRR